MVLSDFENFGKESEQPRQAVPPMDDRRTPLPSLDYPDLLAPPADSRALLPSLDYPDVPRRKSATSRKRSRCDTAFGGQRR